MHFWTFTFPTPVFDRAVAVKRWNAFSTGFLRRTLQARGVAVWERHQSGAWHTHAVTIDAWTLPGRWTDRSGRWRFHGDPITKARWATLRARAAAYSFGRVQVTPARLRDAVPRYLAKYITKALKHRRPQDKGKRFTNYIGYRHKSKLDGKPVSDRSAVPSFAWHSRNASAKRAQIGVFAANTPRSNKDWRWIFKDRSAIATCPACHQDPAVQTLIDSNRMKAHAASWRYLAGLAPDSPIAAAALASLAESLTL